MTTKNNKWTKKTAASFPAFVLAAALAMGSTTVLAQHGGGGHGGGGGGGGHGSSSMDRGDEIDSGHSDSGHSDSGDSGHSKGGKGGSKGMGMKQSGGKAQSLRDVFRELESGAATTPSAATTSSATTSGHSSGGESSSHGSSGKGGGHSGKASTSAATSSSASGKASTSAATTTHGKKGSASAGGRDQTKPSASETEDSDRPAYAGVPGKEGKPGRGNTETGVKKGDLYGDLYVILRDENGVPIYLTLADGTQVVQPVGADGKPLPLDAEGALIDPTLALPVEFGRLSVGRAPTHVLAAQYDEAITSIEAADSVSLDKSGRIVLTTAGVSASIDSPLENLALYTELLNEGYITGLSDAAIAKFNAAGLGYLVDPTSTTLTSQKLLSAADFFAAAADKTTTLNIDKIQDLNAILGISGTLTVDGKLVTDPITGATFVDYSSMTYDRSATYGSVTANVLVLQPDGVTYKVESVNLYDTVFGGKEVTATSAAAFTQAADDSLQVLEYLHDHPVPTTN